MKHKFINTQTTYLYSDRIWINGQLKSATLCIQEGHISDILEGQLKVAVDYSGYVIMPGVIDAHVHINEPGRTEWEGFNSATQAAALGGTTTLIDMPLNSSPVVTELAAFTNKLDASKNKLHVNCGFWAGAVGQETSKVQELIEAGCLGVKVFLSDSGLSEFPNISESNLDLLMGSFKNSDIPILAHCELDTLPADQSLKDNPKSYNAYLFSRPKAWENEAIKLFYGLAEKNNCRAHVVHLASDEIIPWIKNIKEKNHRLSVETCAHYLFFKAEDIKDGNTLLKCAPPIRSQSNQNALKEALKNGIIDFITTDHSPAPASLKKIASGDFTKAWGGISGLQFLLSASWTALRDLMSMETFIPLLTEKPAQFLGLDHQIGYIRKDCIADLCIWSPEDSFKVTTEKIGHKHKETPYLGYQLYGKVHSTYISGVCVMKKGEIINKNKGRIILKKNQKN